MVSTFIVAAEVQQEGLIRSVRGCVAQVRACCRDVVCSLLLDFFARSLCGVERFGFLVGRRSITFGCLGFGRCTQQGA